MLLSLLLIALSLLDCLTVFSALIFLVRSVYRCLMNKDRRRSETTVMMWFSSADVRTKNGMSVNEPGFNFGIYIKHSILYPPIELYFFFPPNSNNNRINTDNYVDNVINNECKQY